MTAYLDEVLAFGLGDEWLELGGGEGVDEASLGDDQQQHLGAGEDGQLVGLLSTCQRAESRVAGAGTPTFFMMPALRFEKVM